MALRLNLATDILVGVQGGEQWRLGKKIGAGSFGNIYLGENINSGETRAVKVEKSDQKMPQLPGEYEVYKRFSDNKHFPTICHFGEQDGFNVMVMELLDKDLEHCFRECKRKMSLKTVCMLADQMITCLQHFHSQGYIHRDIKPDNFMMGKDKNKHRVHLIDVGLATPFKDPLTGKHIEFRESIPLTGTIRYVSVNVHMCLEQGRRDDLESIGYCLIYWLLGKLPWQGIYGIYTMKERFAKIAEIKCQTTVEELCKECPKPFADYMNYIRGLYFHDKPNYDYLRGLFRDLFQKSGFEDDHRYDWTAKPTPGKENSGAETRPTDTEGLRMAEDQPFIWGGMQTIRPQRQGKSTDQELQRHGHQTAPVSNKPPPRSAADRQQPKRGSLARPRPRAPLKPSGAGIPKTKGLAILNLDGNTGGSPPPPKKFAPPPRNKRVPMEKPRRSFAKASPKRGSGAFFKPMRTLRDLGGAAQPKSRDEILREKFKDEDREEVRFIFEKYDSDPKDGFIEQHEMVNMLADMAVPIRERAKWIDTFRRDYDKDGDGKIDFNEFYNWYRNNSSDRLTKLREKLAKLQSRKPGSNGSREMPMAMPTYQRPGAAFAPRRAPPVKMDRFAPPGGQRPKASPSPGGWSTAANPASSPIGVLKARAQRPNVYGRR